MQPDLVQPVLSLGLTRPGPANPVSGLATPTIGVPLFGLLINMSPVLKHFSGFPGMALFRFDELQATVLVLGVVAANE